MKFPHVFHRNVEVLSQKLASRRIKDRAWPAVERLAFNLTDALSNRRFAPNFNLLPYPVVDFLQNRVVVATLLGVDHPLFEIEQLWRGYLDALDARCGHMAVGQ